MSDDTVGQQEEFDLFIEFPDQEGLVQASLGDGVERL